MYRGVHKIDRIPAYTVPSSIPTKYQRVAVTNQEKKGFSSQAKRFSLHVCLNENPGPDSYSCTSSTEVKSPSFSKKGTTGFVASKPASGYSNPQRCIPGPNVYNIQSSFINKHDFNVGVSRVFRLPVAVQLDGQKHETPAPNQYDVTCGSKERLCAVVGTSPFLSKPGRNSIYPNKNVPSTLDRIPGYTVPSSIPTKYQRVVVTNQEKKGFSCQAKRFPLHVCLNENPGPDSYSCTSSTEVKSPSFSKKGTTGFVASKPASGYSNPQRWIPGPNVYNIQSSFINKHDFNVGVSRVFRLPVAVQSDGQKHETPAPNQYDVTCGSKERLCAAVGTSTFISKTGRNSFYPNKNVPSPCQYDVNHHFMQHSSKTVLSPFKSTTRRIPALADNQVPGPGAYSPHQSPSLVKKPMLPRGCCLTISAPPLIVPKDPPLPGPGQYNVNENDSYSKHSVPTAAFASRTERISQISQVDTNPGPGFYDPQIGTKQSFFYNDSGVWIPV